MKFKPEDLLAIPKLEATPTDALNEIASRPSAIVDIEGRASGDGQAGYLHAIPSNSLEIKKKMQGTLLGHIKHQAPAW